MEDAVDPSSVLARERLLATLSHEIRTPLNGVLGMAGLLAETRLDPTQAAYLKTLRECGEHLLGLVNDILDFAKLSDSGASLDTAPVDIEALMQGVCELLSPRAYAAGIEIAWTVDAALPRVVADEGRLRQILFNLAGNAVKLTTEGGVLLSAAVAPGGIGRCRLRLEVKDTGPGINAADQAAIFSEYVQTPAGRQAGGAGLGLAIVKRLAEAFDGAVGLESRVGQGSSFWFEAEFDTAKVGEAAPPLDCRIEVHSPSAVLREAIGGLIAASGGRMATQYPDVALVDAACFGPRARLKPPPGPPALILLAPEERRRIPAARKAGFAGYLIKPLRRASVAARIGELLGGTAVPVSRPDERIAAPPQIRAHVLVADDNPVNALLARALLTQIGCSVERASSGEEAVAAATARPFDLILMDLRMPDMDGLVATQRLRAAGTSTPIVALTANAFDEDRRAALAAGMDDFLTKPLDPQALRAVLARWAGPTTALTAEAAA